VSLVARSYLHADVRHTPMAVCQVPRVRDHMREFLEFIQEPDYGYTEIRAIKNGSVRQFWEADRVAATKLALDFSEDGFDAYYGVIPRMTQRGDASAVAPETSVLWADLDAKDKRLGSKLAALQSLIDYEIPPSVIVDSGHGYHAYWKMSERIPVWRAVNMMKGLATHLFGDHVYDAPRILRVPGTTNWKDPGCPVPVRVLRFDTTRLMRPGDFEHAENTAYRQSVVEAREPVEHKYVPPESRDDLPEWLMRLIVEGAPQGQRSEAIFKVMVHLARRGWSDNEIRDIMNNHTIGEKIQEMRYGGERWFNRSLQRARS